MSSLIDVWYRSKRQKETLQNEIRICERRDKMDSREREERYRERGDRDRDRHRDYRDSRDRLRGVRSRGKSLEIDISRYSRERRWGYSRERW